ncbi:MAG: hypothetical protein NHG13_00040 [Candidatus Shikimatogenerans bostrichidophilus]|nr:MAG: hypothetical protein NHG13_00040 [Candidatus Shikimatogenerans bostrichidophilus]
MVYILNIYEKKKYILSNITFNNKIFINIKKNKYSIHYNLLKIIKKKKFNLNKLNAICVNLGPCISYTKIRNIISSAKGFCLALNIPLIKINSFLIYIYKNKKKIKKYHKLYFFIFSYKKKIKYIIIFDVKKKKFYKKKNIKIKKKNKKILYLYNYINYYLKYIINISYKLYKKKKFIKNINKILPIYN